jgi:hypothetical protein
VGDLEKREREYRLGIVEEVARKKATGEPSAEENLHSIGMCTQKKTSHVPRSLWGKAVPITACNCPGTGRKTQPSHRAHLVAQAARRRAEWRATKARWRFDSLAEAAVHPLNLKAAPQLTQQAHEAEAELEEAKEALKEAKEEEEAAERRHEEETAVLIEKQNHRLEAHKLLVAEREQEARLKDCYDEV